jgi:uncharacterized protein
MATTFLDTSALVKRYHIEEGTSEVDRLFVDDRLELVISRLGFIELLSALAMKVRSGVLSADALSAARKRFLGDVKSRRLSVVRLTASHFRGAEQLISRHATTRRLRTLDAVQLAVASERLQPQSGGAIVSADLALLEIAEIEGLPTLNPAPSTA